MKRLFSTILISIMTMMLTGILAPTGRAETSPRKVAVANFSDQVMLMNVPLKGIYLFAHDDAKMARGEDCTWVYKYRRNDKQQPWEFVLSFHCRPTERGMVDRFVVSMARPNDQSNIREIKEYQFVNTGEGHRVP